MTGTQIGNDHRDFSRITEEVQALWPGFHHQVLGEIGIGGCGRVVKINWTASGKPAVLKYLLSALEPSLSDDSHFHNLNHAQWKRFLEQEARIMYAFREYEAAIPVLDLHSTFQAFVMDFVSEGSLLEHIQEPLDSLEKVRRFLPVIDFLAALQDEGIYHRDVTLDNILMNPDGSLKLADFGLAHNIFEPIVEAIPGGKPGYRYPAPERLVNSERLRNDIQDVFSTTVCLLGWIRGVDPNDLPANSTALLDHCPQRILQALKPVILPEDALPPFGQGSGNFSLLSKRLRSLISETEAAGRASVSTISYLSKEDTYISFLASGQKTVPAKILTDVAKEIPPETPFNLSSLNWIQGDGFEYAFPNIETVRAFAGMIGNWPSGIGGDPVPCIYDSSLVAQITWEQASLFISHHGVELPNREQSWEINLPTAVLQFWLNEKKTENMALIGPCIEGLERYEPINAASPFRIFCVVRNKEKE